MNVPIIGIPDFETFSYLILALFGSPEIAVKIYTIYQEDMLNQLNIDPSSL